MNKGWLLTVEDVLKRPAFQQAVLTAGSRGLSKPVRWVHMMELGEDASFLNGGGLVLVDG